MKKLLFSLLLFWSYTGIAQYAVPTGTVTSGCTVIDIPITSSGVMASQALWYPPAGYSDPANANKRYATFIFLNGAGEGTSNDIRELFNTSLPQLISQGLIPYGIDSVTHDTIRWQIFAPHCNNCGGAAYSFPQLQYTIPFFMQNYRIDTNCLWVGGLSAGGSGTWSMAMGNGLTNTTASYHDTLITKLFTGIVIMANGGYDNNLTNPQCKANLDTTVRRGLQFLGTIGDQDQGYNTSGWFAYKSEFQTYMKPLHYRDSIVKGGTHSAIVWNPPFPLAGRIWSKTQNIWTLMWSLRRNAAVTQLVADAGVDQTITLPTNSIILSGVGTPVPGTSIASYAWTRISGPNTPTITSPAAAITNVNGLIQGTYVFRLTVTSTASTTATDDIQITVNAAIQTGPTVSVGANQNVTLPTTSATITGSALAGTAAISSHTWSFVSGPLTPTITTPSNYTSTVTGMSSPGTYVFKLKVTDANSLSDSGATQVIVINPPPASLHYLEVSPSEYKCTYLLNDSNAYSFVDVGGQAIFTPYIINSRKAIHIAPWFNRTLIRDDSNRVWITILSKASCTRYELDSAGAVFNDVDKIYGYFFAGLGITKDSSKIRYFSDDDTYNFCGYFGKGLRVAPIYLNAPPGEKFIKLAVGRQVLALTLSGKIFQWNMGDTLPGPGHVQRYVQRTLPANTKAVDVATSHYLYNVCTLFDRTRGGDSTMGFSAWWGQEFPFVGDVTGRTEPFSLKALWQQTVPVKLVVCNQNTTHYIDSLGVLRGMGDNPNGEVGNGQELVNRGGTYLTPFNWSWNKNEFQTGPPPQIISPGQVFKNIFKSNTYAYYCYFLRIDDSILNCGRDKSLVGGKGVANNNEATSANWADVLTPTVVSPAKHSPAQYINFIFPTVNAGADQNINTSTTTLTGNATAAQAGPVGYTIAFYVWKKISGPAATITTPTTVTSSNSVSTTVTGLVSGAYSFQLVMTDNNSATWMDTVNVTVGGIVFTPPTVITSGNQTLILPTNSTTIVATVTPHSATITSTTWSKLSGPATGSITTPGSTTTTVTGLVQGVYVFRMTAVDSNAQTTTSDLTINVTTQSSQCGCISNPVPINFPKN